MEITLKQLGLDFLTMLFPAACSLCGGPKTRREPFICSTCLVQLPREKNYLGVDNHTAARLLGMFPFVEAYSFLSFSKKGHVRNLIHKVKYRHQPRLAFQLGVWFASEVLIHIRDRFETIVPVPLHPDKQKSRGYNQSLEIAAGVSHVTACPISEALQRVHRTKTQTQLSRWERFENTSNEFSIVNPDRIKGKPVLLIDDIITTGATMAGSAAPLLANGANGIIIAAIGLTQKA